MDGARGAASRQGTRRTARGLLTAVLMIGMLGLSACESPALGDEPAEATVVRVIDGDTLDVDIDGTTARVRLLNVDTPETKDPNEPVQCMGPEATAFLEERLPQGAPVHLEFDEEPLDPYDRLLAGVYSKESLVNAEIAAAGLGVPVLFEPNDRFHDEVEAASEQARDAGRGLFSPEIACTPAAVVETATAQVEAVPATVEGDPADELALARTAAESVDTASTAIAVGAPGLGEGTVFTANIMQTHLGDLRKDLEDSSTTITQRVQELETAKTDYDAEQERLEQERLEEEARAQREAEEAEEAEMARQAEQSEKSSSSSKKSSTSDSDSGSSKKSSKSDSDSGSSKKSSKSDSGSGSSKKDSGKKDSGSSSGGGSSKGDSGKSSSGSSGCTPYGPEIPNSDDGGYTGLRYGMPGGKTFRKCN